jgi:hypothetical protein
MNRLNETLNPVEIHLLGILVFAGIVTTGMAQAPLASQGRAEDVYTIYSAMITSTMTPQQETPDEIYLIEETTVTNSGGPGCVRAPIEEASILAEVIEDYNQRSNASVVLSRRFTLPKPYELLDGDRATGFLKDALDATPQFLPRGGAAPVNRNPLFQKAKQVFRFSDVYFNKTRTSALAWVAVYTTSVDFRGSWRPYRKSAAGFWEENRSWTACGQSVMR